MAKKKPKPAGDPFNEAEVTNSATDVTEPPSENPKPKRKGRQKYLAGTEPMTIKELEDAAESYVGVRDKRMALTEVESDAKKLLATLMKKHKLATYAFDGQMIEYTHVDEDQVKVKKVRADKSSPNFDPCSFSDLIEQPAVAGADVQHRSAGEPKVPGRVAQTAAQILSNQGPPVASRPPVGTAQLDVT